MVGEYILFSVALKDPTNTHGRLIRWGQLFWECFCLPLGLALSSFVMLYLVQLPPDI